MNSIAKSLFNKLAIIVALIALCVTTGILHNMLVKSYETSTLSKYNIFSPTVYMSQQVDSDSMKDMEHKIKVKVEAQKFTIAILQKIPVLNKTELIKNLHPVIALRMFSGGGSVFAGFGVMNLMRSYQKDDGVHFTTIADKFCYSMCFALLQQGDTRLATYYTVLGTHRASGGDQRVLRLIEEMTAENVIKKSNYFSDITWRDFYWNDFFHDLKTARKYGLIDGEYR